MEDGWTGVETCGRDSNKKSVEIIQARDDEFLQMRWQLDGKERIQRLNSENWVNGDDFH